MAERQRVKTSNTKKARAYHSWFGELAAKTIRVFLSQVEHPDLEPNALMDLAVESMSALIGMEPNDEIEMLLEECKKCTLKTLKNRIDDWQSKLSAVEAQSPAAH